MLKGKKFDAFALEAYYLLHSLSYICLNTAYI